MNLTRYHWMPVRRGGRGHGVEVNLTRYPLMPVRQEFEPYQWLLLFPRAKSFTHIGVIAQYWLVPGTDSSMIYIVHNQTKIN